MDVGTFVTLAWLVVGLVGFILYKCGSENVYLKYKDQKVGK